LQELSAPAAALGLIHACGWLGASRWTQILMAGVSAMAFFRTCSSWCGPVTAVWAPSPGGSSNASTQGDEKD